MLHHGAIDVLVAGELLFSILALGGILVGDDASALCGCDSELIAVVLALSELSDGGVEGT